MILKEIFNGWAKGVRNKYIDKQWLLSKWEVREGVQWPKEKFEVMIQSIKEGLSLKSGHKLIELGCGGGWIIQSLAKDVQSAYGLDISHQMLQTAQRCDSKIKLVEAELAKLPFKDESFDSVLSYFVFINFVEDQYIEKSLLESYRIVKKGGKVLIGQLPDINGSNIYDDQRKSYELYCQKTFKLGNSIRDDFRPPLRLFDRKKIEIFLNKVGIKYRFQDSFNPFYRKGEPKLIDWRFDLILEK